jgi:formylmethanofuran dehydrogenase subunit E
MNVARYYCDKCKQEFYAEELYVDENEEELCIDCLLLKYETVAQIEERE